MVYVEDPGGGTGGGGSDRGKAGDGGGAPVCRYGGGPEISCLNPTTRDPWYASENCYISRIAEPISKPPSDQPNWIYYYCHGAGFEGSYYFPNSYIWLPFDIATPPVDLDALIDSAIEQMNLTAPELGTNPPASGDAPTALVNLPVHLWVADAGESTIGPITRSASAGGVTVTATGEVTRIEWDMGDGAMVVCEGSAMLGQRWTAEIWDAPPICGHAYTRASNGESGGAYTITATAFWTITWSGAGRSGAIPMELVRSVELGVREAPVRLVPGPVG